MRHGDSRRRLRGAGPALDDDGRRPAGVPRRRHARPGPRAYARPRRRLRPRHAALERRGRGRALHEGRHPQAQGSARKERARRQTKRFRADNPRTYPKANWDRYDELVKSAQRLGIGVYFNVTGPGPEWSHRTAPKGLRDVVRKAWRPKPLEFKKFVKAVGKRYSRRLRRREPRARQASARELLVAVERAQPGGLARAPVVRVTPESPRLFRQLYLYGREGLDATGHGRDVILLGETAPLGSSKRGTKSPIRPKVFLRELLCVSRAGAEYKGAAARRRGCSDFDKKGPLRASGYGHHPYTKNVGPTVRDKTPGLRHARERRRARPAPRPARREDEERRGGPAALHDGVRVRDQPSGPVQRRAARPAGAVEPAGRRDHVRRTRGSSRSRSSSCATCRA